MPKVLYDAEGNEVQVPTDEEIQQTTAEKDKQIGELDEKLKKLENKDFNFKRLKDMTDAEREILSVQERGIKQQQEDLQDEIRQFKETQVGEYKNYALSTLAGDDKELRAKMELHFGRLDPDKPAVTQNAIMDRMREAYTLATGGSSNAPSALGMAMGMSGTGGKQKPSEGELTQDQKDLAGRFGLTDEDLKKDVSKVVIK
jgi:hypothetical protein